MFKKVISYSILSVFLMVNILASPVMAAKSPKEDEYVEATVAKILDRTDVFELKAKAAILVDAASGSILVEQNGDERLPIASVTKVMSMLLIMEAIDSGKLSFDDMVSVSPNAAGMGGSQAYLAPGEEFKVHDMMKAIAIHSSNDVTVAMAEKISGTEEAFIAEMNKRAKELGMENTNFLDCTGLTDEGHYSSAHDVAIMSRELITKHPKILEFTSIWHDTFRNGEFSLDNTNKLIKFYDGCDGLKTGFTRKAGHNLSATAKKKDMRLISVVLGEPDSNTRFAESRKLLDYGFANFEVAQVNKKGEAVGGIEVKKGMKSQVNAIFETDPKLLVKKGVKDKITREVVYEQSITAPVKAGQKVGEVEYSVDGSFVGKTDLVAESDVPEATFFRLFSRMFMRWFAIGRK